MSRREAFVAATRFGLGARPGDLEVIEATGARRWLEAQLDGPDAQGSARLAALPPSEVGVSRLTAMRGAGEEDRREIKRAARETFVAEQVAHLEAAAASSAPFRERLAAFWANHFTVSVVRGEVEVVARAFEREVIRANLDGSFEAMLLASARHPAMLAYLDNFRSIGPNSLAGRRAERGLNENFAREILELHTLGVGGGYAQVDVLALAKILTGWGLDVDGAGTYLFHPRRHEPGEKVLLGARYSGRGEQDGVEALKSLARHPSTARHVATKLVRHFVADDPPGDAVEQIAGVFLHSGGHLPTVHRAVVRLEAAWARPLAKLKTPWDLVISTARALGYQDQGRAMLQSMDWLGQLPYEAPSPQGWPDVAAAWLGPEAVLSRLDWAGEVARRGKRVDDVPGLARAVLGPALSERTATTLAAGVGADALALLLASPEFQRR